MLAAPIYLPPKSVQRFPFRHTFSSIYCLWAFKWWPFWLVWGDISWWFWLHFSNNLMCLVIQSCPTLCIPMDCNLPGSSVHGILQARILEWVAMPFSRSSWPRDRNWVSCIAGGFFTNGATRKARYFKAWFLEKREHRLFYWEQNRRIELCYDLLNICQIITTGRGPSPHSPPPWPSGWDFTFHCRGCRFKHWLGS